MEIAAQTVLEQLNTVAGSEVMRQVPMDQLGPVCESIATITTHLLQGVGQVAMGIG